MALETSETYIKVVKAISSEAEKDLEEIFTEVDILTEENEKKELRLIADKFFYDLKSFGFDGGLVSQAFLAAAITNLIEHYGSGATVKAVLEMVVASGTEFEEEKEEAD